MFTFTNQENQPIMIQEHIFDDLFQLNPFHNKPTLIKSYNGNGVFANKDCFLWIAENNIPVQMQCDDFNIMREAGWQLFFNISFYQVGTTLFFTRKPNKMIINSLISINPNFQAFDFRHLTHFKQLKNSVRHRVNDYLPLMFPLKFSSTDIISYYYAKPSEIVYC